MNPVIRRAILTRAALVLGFYGIGFVSIVGGISKTHPPWLAIIGMLIFFCVALITLSVVSDRKLKVRSGRIDPPWLGIGAVWSAVVEDLPWAQSIELAKQAVALVGGNSIVVLGENTVVGWKGWWFFTSSQRREYQLAIVISTATVGGIQFTCCARPRFSSSLGSRLGGSTTRKLVSAMQSEVMRLAGGA